MMQVLKKYKYCFIAFISVLIIFVIGYFVGRLHALPKRIALGGYSHDLRDGYVLNIWYHDNGKIASVSIDNVINDEIVLRENYYPSGVVMSDYRRIPEGLLISRYHKSGILNFRDHEIPGHNEYLREYFSEDGTIIKTETLGGDITDDAIDANDKYGNI